MCTAVALVAAACGSSSTVTEGGDAQAGSTTSTTIDASTATYWVAGDLPDSFGPVLVTDDATGRSISYAPADFTNDVGDAPLVVTVAPKDQYGSTARPGAESIEVAGHPAVVVPLTDEGNPSGSAVTWEQSPGTWIVVWAGTELSRDDVVAVAQDLQPVDSTEWDRLARALSIDTKVGKVEPDATQVEVISGTVAGGTYTLTALVPAGYPLGPEDQRRDCYRLTFNGESSPALCDNHPWWLRIGGQHFVFGPADAGTSEIQVGPYQGGPGDVIVASTSAADVGPPTAFYVVPLDDGRCFVEISRTDGANDINLGAIGPLPDNPEHAACLAQLNPG